MTTEEIVIGAIAAVLVVFSLTVALVVPKRRPGFPTRHTAAFLSICAVLAVGMVATVLVLGGEEETAEAAETPSGEQGAAGEGGAMGGETGAAGGGAVEGDPAAGAELFASSGCGSCHTLADAGSGGAVGPNLDEAKPSYDLVISRVTNGMGAMPAFGGQLSEDQIKDIAAYVSSVAGS